MYQMNCEDHLPEVSWTRVRAKKIATIFQGLFKGYVRFSRTTY